MKPTLIDYEDKIRNRDWVIAFLSFIIVSMLVIGFSIKYDNNDSEACVPKMQGIYHNMQENFSVAVIGTANPTGVQLVGELQNAINQINKLQLQGGTQP